MPKPKVLHALVAVSALIGTSCGTGDIVVSVNPTPTPPLAASGTPTPGSSTDGAPQPTDPAAPTPTPTTRPTPTPTPVPGQLTVTDTDMVGTSGDGVLSLVEAVQLANGRRSLDDLDDGERSYVRGEPGAGAGDVITVDIGTDGRLLIPGGDTWILELFGNDGDVIDGGGAVVTPSAADGESRNVMQVASSDVTITGFTFERVTNAVAVESAGGAVDDVRIVANAFVDTAAEDVSARNSLNRSSINGLTVADNSFTTTQRLDDRHRFVVVQGGLALADQLNSGSAVTAVEISGTTMESVAGATAACIAVDGGVVLPGMRGEVLAGVVEDVQITGNTLTGCTTAVEITGGSAPISGGRVSDSAVAAVAVTDNTISGGERGIVLTGGVISGVDGTGIAEVTNNQVDVVEVHGNSFEAVAVPVQLAGGMANGPAGSARANAVTGLDGDVTAGCAEAVDAGPGAAGNELDGGCADLNG